MTGIGKELKGNVAKADGGGGSGLPRNTTLDRRLCITVPEAAAMLGISRNHAYKVVGTGELPSIRFGNRILIPRVALEKRLERCEQK